MKLVLLPAIAFALLAPSSVQEPDIDSGVWRYEAGKRVRAMERAWAHAPEAVRASVVETVDGAVSQYFRGGLSGVAEAIDAAWLALDQHDRTITDLERAMASVTAIPDARVVPASQAHMGVRVVSLYGETALLDDAQCTLHADFDGGFYLTTLGERGLAADARLTLESFEPGRYLVRVRARLGEEEVETPAFRFEVVEDLAARLAALDEAVGRRSQLDDTIAAHTAHLFHGVVEDLAEGRTLETDYPANALLDAAELLIAGDDAAIGAWLAAPGERWLSVPLERGSAVVRVFVPEGIEAGARVPVVFGLHGAGGSENLFFEAYGAGLGVDLARERGWIFVAPRVGMFGSPVVELADALAAHLPIDRERLFAVGHSMGAMATIKAASANPERFAAIAALGGGGAPSEALAAVPAFVAAGASDFGKAGADALARQLEDFGAETLVHRTYANTEHLLIVQRALPDVFAFFDGRIDARGAVADEPPHAPADDPVDKD